MVSCESETEQTNTALKQKQTNFAARIKNNNKHCMHFQKQPRWYDVTLSICICLNGRQWRGTRRRSSQIQKKKEKKKKKK